LEAHEWFVEIMEAYLVLIDMDKRASYDSQMAGAQSNRQYTGYENASPAEDQKEASDTYQEILAEMPWEFAKTTFVFLILLSGLAPMPLAALAIILALFDFVTGKSEFGFGGAMMGFICSCAAYFS
jgi:hypothetical protein